MERELLLLGLLRKNHVHGYKLIECIERELSLFTDLKKSTAYFLLDKMAQKGWITPTEAREGNRPPKQVFTVTPDGEAAFQDMLRENLSTHADLTCRRRGCCLRRCAARGGAPRPASAAGRGPEARTRIDARFSAARRHDALRDRALPPASGI